MPKNYVLVGCAKGLSRYRLYVHHILKNIFVSFLHVFNIRYIQLFSGAVVIESIFNYPDIGSLTYEAIMSNDYYLAVAIIATISLFILLMNFMIDLAHYWLDPRALRCK